MLAASLYTSHSIKQQKLRYIKHNANMKIVCHNKYPDQKSARAREKRFVLCTVSQNAKQTFLNSKKTENESNISNKKVFRRIESCICVDLHFYLNKKISFYNFSQSWLNTENISLNSHVIAVTAQSTHKKGQMTIKIKLKCLFRITTP